MPTYHMNQAANNYFDPFRFYCNFIFLHSSSYLPSSQKRLSCHQELLLVIWRLCDGNKKFLHHILKTSDMLDLLVPILHHLNEARADPSRLGLIHISVFLLLLLSGERNFGVRLNERCKLTKCVFLR